MTDAGTGRGDPRSNGAVDPDEDRFVAARAAMLRELRANGIGDPEILAAFARVPRERFVPPGIIWHAYDDSALGIGHGQTISQPYIVARMTELLDLPARRGGTEAGPSAVTRGGGTGSGGSAGDTGSAEGATGDTPGQRGGTPGQRGGTPGQRGGTPGQRGGTPGQMSGARLRVLDVGTGSGYQAAILAELDADVVSVERDSALAEEAARRLAVLGYVVSLEGIVVRAEEATSPNPAPETRGRIACVVGDGSLGWPGGAPYDGIVVAAAAPAVPDPLVAQLADGGRLVIPIGSRDRQSLHLLTRSGSRIDQRALDQVVFVPLVGRLGFPG